MAFKIGDKVRLKSGGPVMTVTYVGDEKLDTTWFNRVDATYSVASHVFRPDALIAVVESEDY